MKKNSTDFSDFKTFYQTFWPMVILMFSNIISKYLIFYFIYQLKVEKHVAQTSVKSLKCSIKL